ncbi:hypothetical protein EPIB1_2049 [Tritonibacter mobilis]|nr:hypothetical protein EPIB1_2049 [Tritonibacter mobilis]
MEYHTSPAAVAWAMCGVWRTEQANADYRAPDPTSRGHKFTIKKFP